jgi:uncharacterized protein YxeA
MKKIFIGTLVCLICSVAFAVNQKLDDQLKSIFQKAEKAVQENKIQEADFWLARYMGLTAYNEETKRDYTDLYPLFKKRDDLAPTAFISGKYSDNFIEFFIMGPCTLWGIPEKGVKEDAFEFEVRGNSQNNYYAAIVISPRLESWSILKKDISKAIIPLVSSEKPPFIISGKLKDGKPVKRFARYNIDTDGKFLHYIWPVEFYDLNGNGVPEIWVRYNVAWADGFSQRLDIYQIKDDKELVLLKRFEGEAEGIARKLKNGLIEVGEGFTDKEATGHLYFDQYHIQTFEHKNGDFVKISEKDVPHILWNKDWEKYYFEE